MVYVGDRFKFKPYGDGYFRAQIVSVTRVSANSDFWCLFKKTNASESELLCQSQEVPGPWHARACRRAARQAA